LIWYFVILGFIVTVFILVMRKRDVKKIEIYPTSSFQMSRVEDELFKKVNDYREEIGLDILAFEGYMFSLARERVQYWIDNGIKNGNLHINFFGHREPYMERAKDIAELANYGYHDDFEAFKQSSMHRNAMLLYWRFMAVSIEDGYCCVILAR